jgi:hypothetical protein
VLWSDASSFTGTNDVDGVIDSSSDFALTVTAADES